MALNNELSSTKHDNNIKNMVTNLDSTISQLETTETSNTQLQQKVRVAITANGGATGAYM